MFAEIKNLLGSNPTLTLGQQMLTEHKRASSWLNNMTPNISQSPKCQITTL